MTSKTSKFWNNVAVRLDNMGKSQKWLSENCKISKQMINSGISRESSPSADHAYRVAQVFDVSIEELLDDGAGAAYIQKVARNDPAAIQVPDRIFPIVKNLLLLDDRELSGIQANAEALVKDKKGTQDGRSYGEATGTDG